MKILIDIIGQQSLLSVEVDFLRKMATLANSIFSVPNARNRFLSGSLPMQADPCLGSTNLFIGPRGTAKLPKNRKSLKVQAGRDGSGLGGAGVFISGFLLGGVAVGTLGAIYAPQLSEALVGEQRKVLLRKLPKFIYNEEKELEKTRQKLTAKIAELNSSLDHIIADIHAGDSQKRPRRRTADKIEASS